MHREIQNLPPIEAFQRLADLPGCLLLDSARQTVDPNQQALGRYSFLMADPFETVVHSVGSDRPLRQIDAILKRFPVSPIPGLPPMQGGVAGLFSYDLNRSFETLAAPLHDEFEVPAIVVGAYDVVIAWDHVLEKAWIISHGFPATEPDEQARRANQRADYFVQRLATAPKLPPAQQLGNHDQPVVITADQLMAQHALDHPALSQLTSNFSQAQYLQTVQHCIDYIVAGDVFQINLAQRLLHPIQADPVWLYRQLRTCNPAPFAGYFDLSQISESDTQIISASPERFFSVRDRTVETRPIKGTRRRTGRPLLDIRERSRLLASEKDRSENTMIVDLMRNDLSPVCTDDSICVRQLCQLETYQNVLHLVSSVTGQLKPEASLSDLLAAVFPGGSITGAPKVRAMQIIGELERTARGAYCGSLGYLGFDGSADFNILIRTITASGGWWQFPVGGGVVVQSNPESEYQETWTKAAGILNAIQAAIKTT